MADHPPTWPVSVRCEGCGVGRRGLSDDRTRQADPARRPAAGVVLARRTALSAQTPPRDGSRRLPTHRQDAGSAVGRGKGRRVMQPAGGSVAGRRRRAPQTTESRQG